MLLLCDLDDTVVDRAGAFRAWAEGFVRQRGLAPDALAWLVEHDDDGYRDRPEFFAGVRDHFGLTTSAAEMQRDYYRVFPGLVRCEPDVADALRQVRAGGWRIAIVTNGSPSQEDKIFATGLDRLVDAWCISSVEGVRKPDPRLLHLASERCRERLDGAWLIGDSPFADVGAAHAAGLSSVWLTRGRSWPRHDYRPSHEATSFAEAVGYLPD